LAIDTGASMAIAKPDITTGLSKRDPSMQCALQMVSREILPILKEPFVKLTLERRPQITWVFIASATDEFILGLDVMHTHDASVDLRCHMLQLDDEEVALRHPGARPRLSARLMASSEVAVVWCDRITAVRLEGGLEVVDSLTRMGSRAAHQGEARTLVQPSREVPVSMTGD
jgi:hypothetical protein